VLGGGVQEDADPDAVRHDLPEMARFMPATGLGLGETLGVTG
jgi:hypothetical protein